MSGGSYDYVHGKHKPRGAMILCADCFQPMNAIYSRAVRITCAPCGGRALRDSREATIKRQTARKSA